MESAGGSVISDFLKDVGGCAIVDGGLATELERHGADLNDPLWSAKCLVSSPHLIRQVHVDYLEAGAEIIITASYQATIQGFQSKGLSIEESEALLRKSVEVACEARNEFWQRCEQGSNGGTGDTKQAKHPPVLVAASIGSYGAFLADGSEYNGNYGDAVTLAYLKDFHRRRVQVLAEAGADLLAFETIPNKIEAQAYAQILEENDIKIPAWFSFNSKDGFNVVGGDPMPECASVANSCKQVVAVGINCSPPRFINGLILAVRKLRFENGEQGDQNTDNSFRRLELYAEEAGRNALTTMIRCVMLISCKNLSAMETELGMKNGDDKVLVTIDRVLVTIDRVGGTYCYTGRSLKLPK
ncbi:sulfide-quinone oxidoreductase [Asimina triloba]